jgi:hypothetical protein
MQRPEPKKHDMCEGCLEPATLLMPVGYAPGFPIIVWQRLCLRCRMGATSSQWATLETDLKHSKHKSARAAHPVWLAAEA